MEYQKKKKNLLDNRPNQPSKFRTKNWVEVNYDARGTYNTNSQIKYKTSMLKISLSDYKDRYILGKGTIKIVPVPPPTVEPNNDNREVVFKNCALIE